jgi:small subunit ribosomal protein S8
MKTIANLLNNINNAQQNYKHFLKYPASKLTVELANLLRQEHFIRGFFLKKIKNKEIVYILLKYGKNKQIFYRVYFASKQLVYKKYSNLSKHKNGLGAYVLSSSKGLLNNNDALKLGLGGVLLLKIS